MYVDVQPENSYPLWVRAVFLLQRRASGQVLTPVKIWARRPFAFLCFTAFWLWLDRKSSPIPEQIRSMIQVRVSQINHCAFCVDLNSSTLLRRGISTEKLSELEKHKSSSHFNETERLFLSYAEQITFSDQRVLPQTAAEIKSRYGELGLIEATALIAFQNLSSKFNASLDIPAQGLCQIRT